MRVLIATGLYPPEIGGSALYAQSLARALPKRGIDVLVLPFSRVSGYSRFLRHLVYFFLLCREMRRGDVVLAVDPLSVGVSSLCAAFLMRKKFILKVSGDDAWKQALLRFGFSGTVEEFQTAELSFAARLLRTLERVVARNANAVIVPSLYLKRIVGMWGVPSERLQVIYDGIEAIQGGANKLVLRGLINFHGKLIISIGALVSWKGFAMLIDSLPAMRETFPGTKLLIVGSGPDLAQLEQQAELHNLSDAVIFTGVLEREILLRYIRAADASVLNVSDEGSFHEVLEIMAVGIPVIATAVGENLEVIEHEKNGFLITPGDREALIRFLSSLLAEASVRARLISAAKRTAQKFSDERMVAETSSFLRKL